MWVGRAEKLGARARLNGVLGPWSGLVGFWYCVCVMEVFFFYNSSCWITGCGAGFLWPSFGAIWTTCYRLDKRVPLERGPKA